MGIEGGDRETRLRDFAYVALVVLLGMGVGVVVSAILLVMEWQRTGHWFLPGMPPYIP